MSKFTIAWRYYLIKMPFYIMLHAFHCMFSLYRVTSPGSIGRESLGCTLVSDSLSPWQAAGLETVLTFVVGMVLFASADPERKSTGSDALALGIAYLVCSLVAVSNLSLFRSCIYSTPGQLVSYTGGGNCSSPGFSNLTYWNFFFARDFENRYPFQII